MNELQRYLVEEAVEDYEDGRLTRREALKAIAGITGAALAAQMLEARAQVAPAGKAPASSAPLVAPDDPAIVAGIAEVPGEGVRLDGYLARPAGTGRQAIVRLCHENPGLTRQLYAVPAPRAKRRWASTARPSARSSTRTWTTVSTTIPARATTRLRRRPRGARRSRGSENTWRRKIHDVRGQAEGRNMALSNACKGFACSHSSFGGGPPPHADDFGRRDFLIDALAATAGLTGLGGCAAAVMQASNPADTILVNARIATLAPRAPAASALAIRGGELVAVGAAAEIEGLRGPDTRVIDAGGRTVIPGLNDGHTHFIRGGFTYTIEVRWEGVPSLAEAMRRVREQARRTPAPHWVQVIGGWTWAQFAEQRHPTLEEINAATGDTPCMIMHLYDRAWLNRAGIRALGWTKDTPNMFGGAIERDASGNPTGLVMSTTSLASLVSVWLRIPRLSPEDQILSTRHLIREHNRFGVTSVIDVGGGGQNYPENYAAIAKLAADEQMTLRIGYMLFAQAPGKELDNYAAWSKLVKYGQGDEYYRMIGTGEYILYQAGDVANFAKDYPVPPPGVMEKNFSAVVDYIVAQGWPFRQHTSFDASASRVLAVLQQVNREMPLKNLRWGLDHCEALHPQTLERVPALGRSIHIQNPMLLDGV